MKRIAFLILSVLLTVSVFAQDPGATEKNAGNAAVKAKNYPEAFKQYEAFDMSIKNNYKGASSYLGKAQAQKSQNKTAEMLTTLQDGMKAFPGNMKLETMYAAYYMKEGQTFQKAGDEAKAAENYTKVVNLTTKSFKTQGLASLASLYFNNGAKILQAATPIANSDKAKYDAEKAKAVNDFKKAKDYLVQAQSLDPANQDVKDLMKQVNEALK